MELLHHPWLRPLHMDPTSHKPALSMHRTSSVPRLDFLTPSGLHGRERDTKDFNVLPTVADADSDLDENIKPLATKPSISDPGDMRTPNWHNNDTDSSLFASELRSSNSRAPRSLPPMLGSSDSALWGSDLSPLISAFQGNQSFGSQVGCCAFIVVLPFPLSCRLYTQSVLVLMQFEKRWMLLAGQVKRQPSGTMPQQRSPFEKTSRGLTRSTTTLVPERERPGLSRARSGILSDDSHLVSLGPPQSPISRASKAGE